MKLRNSLWSKNVLKGLCKLLNHLSNNMHFKICLKIERIINISILCNVLHEFMWLIDILEYCHTVYLVIILTNKGILELFRLDMFWFILQKKNLRFREVTHSSTHLRVWWHNFSPHYCSIESLFSTNSYWCHIHK